MKKKNIWIALLALLIVGGVYNVTLAFFTDAKNQTNVFVLGKVDILLSEPQFSEDTDGTYLMKEVMPNQEIKKDPQITVGPESLDVYLRASITYEGLSDEEIMQFERNIKFKDGWYKGEDGNFYYNKQATKNETIQIFTSVVIPSQWGNEILSREFKVTVRAEAIQSDYFTPDTKEVNGEVFISSWKNKDGTVVEMK